MTSQYFVLPEDWGTLQAIVSGSGSGSSPSSSSSWNHTCYSSDPFMEMPSFPGLFEGAACMFSDELQELYKPFYSGRAAGPTTTPSVGVVKEEPGLQPEHGDVCGKVVAQDQQHMDVSSSGSSTLTSYVPKYKRRKNQQKRVVIQVTAEDLTSDKWAWRKYGQKPIKGSPYPRSYYRCSSSKGCLARKQVEQSCTDPGVFIITYTAEHNHSQPTRRNALAGTVRQKFGYNNTQKEPKSSTTSPALLSPGTPRVKDEVLTDHNYDYHASHTATIAAADGLSLSHKNGKMLPEECGFGDMDNDLCSWLNDLDGLISELESGNGSGTISSESDFL